MLFFSTNWRLNFQGKGLEGKLFLHYGRISHFLAFSSMIVAVPSACVEKPGAVHCCFSQVA